MAGDWDTPDWGTPDWAYDELVAELDAARERIAELEARERKLFGALHKIAYGLWDAHVAHRFGRAVEIAEAALSPYTPAAPEMPADCHPQGET